MKFEWITEWETIWSEQFQSQWLDWMDRADNAHVFFHPAMARAWVDTYMPLRDIRPLFCIATEGENTIFLPLVLWRKNWKNAYLRTIVPVGYSDFDYHEPIVVGSMDVMAVFWDELLKELDKKKSDYDEFLTDDIFTAIDNAKYMKLRDESCPFINLQNFTSLEYYLDSLSKSSRKDLKRSLRLLNEDGTVDYRVLNFDEAIDTLPLMLKTHEERYPNAYKAPKFHENLIKNLLEKNLLHFSVITLNNNIISWRIGFIYKNTYYSYMPVFDSSFAKLAPSKVHLLLAIEDMLLNHYMIFDLMRGAKSYKNLFTTDTKEIYSYKIHFPSLSSKIKYGLLHAKSKFQ